MIMSKENSRVFKDKPSYLYQIKELLSNSRQLIYNVT